MSAADVVVIGAGIVGLACGAALAAAGRSVIVVEREDGLGRGTTSRNSQVIHAGIYYPAGSTKARTCVRGRELVYERCARDRVGHRQTGKWIVATDDAEVAALETLRERGRRNGVDLDWATPAALAEAEPQVRATAALHSPRTGIVDAHALCASFAAELEREGGALALRTTLRALTPTAAGWRLELEGADGRLEQVACSAVVNAAGLASDAVAALAGIDVDAAGLRLAPCKGSYFTLHPRSPVRPRGLVYPVPSALGLGVHATVDLAGAVRFGPDAEPEAGAELSVDPSRAELFAGAARRYLPGLEARWLAPDQAGLRPRLVPEPESGGLRDFVVREESALGAPGLVDCIGIESPGLTAAPAIAEEVVALLAAS